jgi:hypothetical protein
MGSGRSREFIGAFDGTGADLEIRKVGFRPNRVVVHNVEGLCKAEWSHCMADDSALKTITDGTISHITTNGITPLSDGFALGADTDLNVSGESGWFVATD